MDFEKSQEQQPSAESKDLKKYAENAVSSIRSLKSGVDIDTLFPHMRELMKIPDGHETFRRITDEVQVCQ